MIHEEDLTKEQNAFIDALEDDIDNPDVRLQRVFEALSEEWLEFAIVDRNHKPLTTFKLHPDDVILADHKLYEFAHQHPELDVWDVVQIQRVTVTLDHKYARDYNKPQKWPDIDTIRKVCVMEGIS